jgi:hypothetical protein
VIRGEKGPILEIIMRKDYEIKEYKGLSSSLARALPVGCRLNLTKFHAATNRPSRLFSKS